MKKYSTRLASKNVVKSLFESLSLYRKNGYREVGVFINQGKLGGHFVDIMIMEKLLSH